MFPGCDYCLPESELAGFAGALAEADRNNLASYHPAGLMMLSGSLRAGDPGECGFSPDTLVSTDDGYVPIAGVITGTHVLAWAETANVTGYYPVTHVWVHSDPVLVVLVVNGETITTTPEHPFYTPMHGWLPAGELWVGAGMRRADGGAGVVESTITVTRTELMWNLTVDVAHTFFVGDGEWVVHNAGAGCPNPGGKLGGPLHRAKVAEIVELAETTGTNPKMIVTEYQISTPQRSKSTRFLDVAIVNEEGELMRGYQIGRLNKNGTPVAREVRAINDVFNEKGRPISYIPYE